MGPRHRAAYAVVSDRKKLTFEQAERDEPLPGQLQPKEVSQELRAARWRVIFDSSENHSAYPSIGGHAYFREPWSNILRRGPSSHRDRASEVNRRSVNFGISFGTLAPSPHLLSITEGDLP
jgi:hypothetical protein